MSQLVPHYHYLPWFKESFEAMIARFDQGGFPQSLLITGEQDIGKRYFAEDLARSILCLSRSDDKACGHCQSCLWLDKNNHPDFLPISALEKSNFIRIDQIRQLTQFVQMTSETGQKVVIIHNADEMNGNAANALLKTLEEPTQRCYLILVSDYPKKLPVTITSRCQNEYLTIHNNGLLVQAWLEKNNLSISATGIENILRLSYGRPLLSQKFIDSELLGLASELEVLFTKYIARQKGLEELSVFIAKNWQLSSHMLLFWMSSAVKANGSSDSIVKCLASYDACHLMNLCDGFIQIVRLESTTIKQDWLINEWLLAFH